MSLLVRPKLLITQLSSLGQATSAHCNSGRLDRKPSLIQYQYKAVTRSFRPVTGKNVPSKHHHGTLTMKRLLIIGSGFAGMYAAMSAARLRDLQGVSPHAL